MPIQTEEDFKKAKEALIKERAWFHSSKFHELERFVREALLRQDSDTALTLITKGSLSLGGSDIHYDTKTASVAVRLRVDGNLTTIFELTLPEYKLVLERIKYKSNMKLNLTQIPQDGKYRIEESGDRIDVRVSTLPVKLGENMVCRILDSTNAIPAMSDLGFMWTSKRQIEKSTQKKNGMILVTGPTGSGKTTTLYSILSTLNTPDRKVITLEDPVEYELDGVVQSEVNEKNNYTYASGLKALLRQDPDVIMIGEVRDLETADIAAQASLTGHLVLSTLHTKSASETVERLSNMGLPPYILASSIDIIIAQRLVRRICPHCSELYEATLEETETIKWMMKDIGIEAVSKAKKNGFTLHRGNGCEQCGYTGFKGRVGIFEVLYFSDEIRTLIRNGASPAEILAKGREQDLMLMREDGVLKAMRGKTTIEELFSVID